MIIIQEIRCRNFLSYGNAETVFSINSHKATLLRGKNGHGKSVLLDLVMYAMYGVPYRNINKIQLVNSLNQKGLVVEVDFEIHGVQYNVIRGMKPTIFDIFRNGELIEQNAASRDYQSYLENSVLKCSERTFKQIAVLGSASFVPFMQMPAGARRELVESILDIEIFSKMNILLRDRVASTREEFNAIGHKLDIKKSETLAQQKLIKVIQENTKSRVEEHENKKAELLKELTSVMHKIVKQDAVLAQMEEPPFDDIQYTAVRSSISAIKNKIQEMENKLKNICDIDECPVCMQTVSEKHLDSVSVDLKRQIKDSVYALRLREDEYELLKIQRDELSIYQKQFGIEMTKSQVLEREKSSIQKQIAEVDSLINAVATDTSDIENEKLKLKQIADAALNILNRKSELSEEKHIQEVASQLLKDTGIKTAVVKEYLPVLNQLINKYLAMFEFFVDFQLDESFNETIRSRGRDVFSYSSFSQGEKAKIDFSILMAFRQLAALKNSAKTNILIFDELADGALDLESRSMFNSLLENITNSNIFVISHADASTEMYDRVIHVEKKADFSTYTVVE